MASLASGLEVLEQVLERQDVLGSGAEISFLNRNWSGRDPQKIKIVAQCMMIDGALIRHNPPRVAVELAHG